MAISVEEQQAQEFLKRAEIRTMKKDLRALREFDALSERDKIAKIKTIDEQRADQAKLIQQKEAEKSQQTKVARDQVLQKNVAEERLAEKDLKNYATEEEKQKIFLLETERFNFEKKIEEIDKTKDPIVLVEKNKSLLEQRDLQVKFNNILVEEKKLEDEEGLITGKEQTSTVPSEKKSLEQRRWELDKLIQDIEKKRWEIERQKEALETRIKEIDKGSEQNVLEKNDLRNKVLGVDKSLREIYSVIIARVQDKRSGLLAEQKAKKEATAKIKVQEKEVVRRREWANPIFPRQGQGTGPTTNVPNSLKEKIARTAVSEEEQRKKFLADVEQGASKNQGQQQEKSNIK